MLKGKNMFMPYIIFSILIISILYIGSVMTDVFALPKSQKKKMNPIVEKTILTFKICAYCEFAYSICIANLLLLTSFKTNHLYKPAIIILCVGFIITLFLAITVAWLDTKYNKNNGNFL